MPKLPPTGGPPTANLPPLTHSTADNQEENVIAPADVPATIPTAVPPPDILPSANELSPLANIPGTVEDITITSDILEMDLD
jgi:hypothetical protein